MNTRPLDDPVVSLSRARMELPEMFRRARDSHRPVTVVSRGEPLGQIVAVSEIKAEAYVRGDKSRHESASHDVTVRCHVCGNVLGLLSRDRAEAMAETVNFLALHLNHPAEHMAAAAAAGTPVPAFAARLGTDEQPLPFPGTAA